MRDWPGCSPIWRILPLVLIGCGSDGPTDPDPLVPPDPARGLMAFTSGCAPCHASGDGFDLAYFGFPASDIVRRGVAHVDSTEARDIVAYVESLGVEPVGPDFRLFQAGGALAQSDGAIWRDVFGTDDWPEEGMTVEWLRALDLRDVPVPVPFPSWSSEIDESDWMPDVPLPVEVLDAEQGAVRGVLDSYLGDPSMEKLLAVVETFRRVTGDDGPLEQPVCEGDTAAHVRPLLCFEARRWVASLTATHLFRQGEFREIPFEVARLWWEVGEVGVSVSIQTDAPLGRLAVAAWLYMSSIFAPDGFPGQGGHLAENTSYMGQFLQGEGLPRLATLVTLHRMVQTGPAHEDRPLQAYWDLNLASIRAPRELVPDVLEFGLEYLLSEQARGHLPTLEDREDARFLVGRYLDRFDQVGGSGDPDRDARIHALAEEVAEGLAGTAPVPRGSTASMGS